VHCHLFYVGHRFEKGVGFLRIVGAEVELVIFIRDGDDV